MRSFCWALALAVGCLLPSGCARLAPYAPDTGHGDLWDAVFKRRHTDVKAPVHNDPVLSLAREVTVLEDDIRRDGSITVKMPDVWGDGDLMHYIQEYDERLSESVKTFNETLQAYIARSDAMELQSATGLGMAVGRGAAPIPAPTEIKIDNQGAVSSTGALTPTPHEIQNLVPSEVITKARAGAPPKVTEGIGVEPTELERQRSTFILVNQALRRRNTGDDGSRAAGYALYKFRIPVSILPGRETYQGHSAVVTLRAQLHVDEAHLRYTFPKLVIADLVETLTPVILDDWGKASASERQKAAVNELLSAADTILRAAKVIEIMKKTAPEPRAINENKDALEKALAAAQRIKDLKDVKDLSKNLEIAITDAVARLTRVAELPETQQEELLAAKQRAIDAAEIIAQSVDELTYREPGRGKVAEIPTTVVYAKGVFGERSVYDLRCAAEEHFSGVRPKPLELRNYLFKYLGQVHSVLKARQSYANPCPATGNETVVKIIECVGEIVEKGGNPGGWREWWITGVESQAHASATPDRDASRLARVSWLVAVQSGILNRNLHRILDELHLRGKLSDSEDSISAVQFFTPDGTGEAARLWDILVRETFPLHVFALDPQVEEQNAYDAFSRRREMQLALAISVATGRINAGQKVALSRQLALDEATIAMNRTAVAFSHGNDTFGWYFYPRVQTPPTESSNIGAMARMIWSTGPTECYDLKHRKLEPGMRECEVLVAMPSFVTEVSFDVTTNWESLARPGVTKRSYEEMVAQGGRLHRLRTCLQEAGNQQCYRPGDYARLLSRIDQLEQMLGMQTHMVSVPYEYEQTGTDLFDTGKAHLRPVLHGYYGLEFVQAEDGTAAFVFLTGKNFHPTLTHVIVGGAESQGKDDCEVISRDLLRVKIGKVRSVLSRGGQFEVRVGTPAGLSEALTITAAPGTPVPRSEFDWDTAPAFKAELVEVRAEGKETPYVRLDLETFFPREKVWKIINQTPRLPTPTGRPKLVLDLSVKFKSGGERNLGVTDEVKKIKWVEKGSLSVESREVIAVINAVIAEGAMNKHDEQEGVISGTTYLKFDQWPYIRFDKMVTVEFRPKPPRAKEGTGRGPDGAGILPLPPTDHPDQRISIGLRDPGPGGGPVAGSPGFGPAPSSGNDYE